MCRGNLEFCDGVSIITELRTVVPCLVITIWLPHNFLTTLKSIPSHTTHTQTDTQEHAHPQTRTHSHKNAEEDWVCLHLNKSWEEQAINIYKNWDCRTFKGKQG